VIIKEVQIEKFRAFNNTSFKLGKYITAIAGRNATQKTTVLGLIGQPFTISQKDHPLFGCKTIDGYDFKSQFSEKFKFSDREQAGEHRWTVHLYNSVYIYKGESKSYFTSETIVRERRTGKLRIWNAEDKKRETGGGYVQVPVYYLSLSRLFPIGETVGRTIPLDVQLTQKEHEYCMNWYRKILRIQADEATAPATENIQPVFGVEEKTAKLKFAGVTDGKHDIKTNSAGEGNISRIILAMLSFKRLYDQKNANCYRGGLLLIDELDAAVYPRSQKELVKYLRAEAKNYRVQVVFTTHSPIVLQELNDIHLEGKKRIIGLKSKANSYKYTIVYLEPDSSKIGQVNARNIGSARELRRCLDNMDFKPTMSDPQMRVYCEDAVASGFLKYVLAKYIDNTGEFFDFQEINFGWTNYVTLLEKNAFKVRDSLIMLDADVPTLAGYDKHKALIEECKNVVILPIVVEEGLFRLLKDKNSYSAFLCSLHGKDFPYEVCFNEWIETSCYYKNNDRKQFKQWYKYVVQIVGVQPLYDFWLTKNKEDADTFVKLYINAYNKLADRLKLDPLPMPVDTEGEGEDVEA
jgi:AAA15 family ATPase/GTPase